LEISLPRRCAIIFSAAALQTATDDLSLWLIPAPDAALGALAGLALWYHMALRFHVENVFHRRR